MIDGAIRRIRDDGADYVTLGLAPLSRRAVIDAPHNPPWLRALLAWVHAHGRRFYNFDGLDAFKAKFQPEVWEPVFAIAAGKRFTIGMLYAVAAAFAGGSPAWLLLRGVVRQFRRELFGRR